MANTCKYQKLQRFISYDSGSTWQPLQEFQKGTLIEADSPDCGGGGSTIDRWINGWMCDECVNYKFVNTTSGGTTYSVLCNSSTTITSSEIENRRNIATSKIGECVTAIGDGAFSGCTNLTNVNIPNTVTSIGDRAFNDCKSLLECGIPDSVTSIGVAAFSGCVQMHYISLPNNLESLGESAFTSSFNFTNINIPSTLTSIPAHCFDNCDGLSDIEVQATIQSIGDYAFANCNGLYFFTIYATTPPTLGSNVFSNVNSKFKIFVPSEVVNTYKTTAGWSTYSSKIYAI